MFEDTDMLTAENAVLLDSYPGDNPFETYRAVQITSQPRFESFSTYSDSDLSSVFNGFSKHSKGTSYSLSPFSISEIQKSSIVPSSSSQHKCSEKPYFLSEFSSFYLDDHNFDLIKERVEQFLNDLSDHVWDFDAEKTIWNVKYFHGSCLREIAIQCFWDSILDDHLIEVKKIRCEGFPPSGSNCGFYKNLKAAVSRFHQEPEEVAVVTAPSSSSTKRSNLREPLPFPVSMKTGLGTAKGFVPPVVITTEQFIGGIRPIASMAACPFFETRIEAAKMLCDLAGKDLSFLELPECRDICLKSLESLVADEFEEVRQFAIMAFSLFMQIPSYRSEAISLVKGLEVLLLLIRNAEATEQPSFQTLHIRRQAAESMALIASVHPFEVGQLLRNTIGFASLQIWLEHCASISDQRIKESALALCQAFFL